MGELWRGGEGSGPRESSCVAPSGGKACCIRAVPPKVWSQASIRDTPGDVLEMQAPAPHLRPADSETLWVGPRSLNCNKHSGDPDTHPSLRTTALEDLESMEARV